MDATQPAAKPLALFVIALVCIIFGGLLGAFTNAINGALSPLYFVNILGWVGIDVWRAAVAQGVFEGLIYGAIFAIVFTIVVGIVSRGGASLGFALRHIATAGAVALACWCLGGLLAMGLATLSPGFYRSTFIGVPQDSGAMLGYAWAGGSIWGVLFGAVISLALALVLATADWRRRYRRDG